jgi:hypothetical protein
MTLSEVLLSTSATITRRFTAFWRRSSRLRHHVPAPAVRKAIDVRSYLTQYRRLYIPILTASPYDNIFHCCVHKTGSQWIISLLRDPVLFRYSGMSFYHSQRAFKGLDARGAHETTYDRPFPARTIVGPLYTTYENFLALPKHGSFRAFFVARDPRDLLVSWYYSAKDNHIIHKDPKNPLLQARNELQRRNKRDGLLYAVDYLERMGRFAALRSWFERATNDENVKLVRYEELIGPRGREAFRELFDFLGLEIPERAFNELLDAYSFKRLSGRPEGVEDSRSHLRKATSGDWRNHLDVEILERLESAYGDLVEVGMFLFQANRQGFPAGRRKLVPAEKRFIPDKANFYPVCSGRDIFKRDFPGRPCRRTAIQFLDKYGRPG